MNQEQESILISIKKMLGGVLEYDTVFDADIIDHINAALFVLSQIGVGIPGFRIEGPNETWSDFLGGGTDCEAAKTDVYLQVKQSFDPPSSSAHQTALKERSTELQWRLNFQYENKDE